MNEVAQDIVNWLHGRQDWLQEAAEHIINGEELSDADINHLVSRLKTEGGRAITASRRFEALDATPHVPGELRLVSVGDIEGIENLAPNKALTLGSGNMVVVYGPNGSGKSGYTRIIKSVCGRPLAQPLSRNVFEAPPTDQKCVIRYRVTDVDKTVEWRPADAGIAELRVVDFFDANAASAYLCDETEPAYTPRVLTYFQKLASCCNRVKAKLEEERDHLVSSLPALPPAHAATAAGRAFQQLRPDPSASEIDALTTWTTSDDATLGQLVGRMKAEDPDAAAKQKRGTKVQVDRLIAELEHVGTIFSEPWLRSLRTARDNAHEKRRVAIETAEACSQSAKLGGIGTETWGAMWKAAREYSKIPYPHEAFPVTTAGARCVLCHQILSNDAPQRLRDFEAYVQGTVEADAKAAEGAYSELLDSVPLPSSDEDFRSRCETAGIDPTPFEQALDKFWAAVRDASAKLKTGEANGEAGTVAPPEKFLCALKLASATLESEAERHDNDAKTDNRLLARRHMSELEARKWVSQQVEAIRSEIARLKQVESLERLAGHANSRQVSIKAGDINETIVTAEYVRRFNAELAALGAERIRVELIKSHTERGRTLHKLVLKGVRAPRTPPEAVLSDGERRVVTLAAFLADVGEKPYASPFVFDDPISSLDSEYEWRVATRLVQLSERRQVLVFTHRLSLYGYLSEIAKKQGRSFEPRYITAFSGSAGHPADEQVGYVNTKKANKALLTRLDAAAKASAIGDVEGYDLIARGICSDFRILVERTIEDDLLGGVVKRHRRNVMTNGLLERLASINQTDCTFLDGLMTKYSCYEHSQSQEVPIRLPEEQELRTDLVLLRDWRDEFATREVEHG